MKDPSAKAVGSPTAERPVHTHSPLPQAQAFGENLLQTLLRFRQYLLRACMAAANPCRASLSIAATLVEQFPPADVGMKGRVIWSMG